MISIIQRMAIKPVPTLFCMAGLIHFVTTTSAMAQVRDPAPPDQRSPNTYGTQRALPATPGAPLPLPPQTFAGGRLGAPGVIQGHRWTEDWNASQRPGAPLVERIKHIPFGPDDVFLTLGGEARLYYADWHHSLLGLRPGDSNSVLQQRLRLLADLHIGQNVRTYLEIGDNREFGAELVAPPNRDKLDIYQAFVDVSVPIASGKLTIRPGRFELPLGSGKLAGVRDGLNVRFTYQGIEGTYSKPGRFSIVGFDLRPVNLKPGTFDDGPLRNTNFTGIYGSGQRLLAGFSLDAYFYRVERPRALLLTKVGADRRDNHGLRIWRRELNWDLDIEANVQRGSFAGKQIRSYAVLAEGSFIFLSKPYQPRIGLRANLFSGNAHRESNTSNTFVAVAPRVPIITEAAFFNLSNLTDIYPYVVLKPSRRTLVTFGPDFLWRSKRSDGVYVGAVGSGFAPYRGSRHIGIDLNIDIAYQATERLFFKLADTYFNPASDFRRIGGKRSNYFGVLSQYRF
jgi:hypothetical protein